MSPSTPAQRAYIERLAYELRCPPQDYGPVDTFADASRAIDYLLNERRRVWADRPMSADMRRAIFAALRKSGRTKEDLYAALGIESLSDAAGGSVLRGRRCLQWIADEPLEPDHVERRVSLAEAWEGIKRLDLPRPVRPDGYVPIDPLAPDPVFHPDPEPTPRPDPVLTPAPVVQAPCPPPRRMGRPGIKHPSQLPPVVTTATAPAPIPTPPPTRAAPLPPVRRPMSRPGIVPGRPVPVAQPPKPVPVAQSVYASEDKPAVAEAKPTPADPFSAPGLAYREVFVPRALPVVDAPGLSAVEVMTRGRFKLLNELLNTDNGIDFLVRAAEQNWPSWRALAEDWSRDIPF